MYNIVEGSQPHKTPKSSNVIKGVTLPCMLMRPSKEWDLCSMELVLGGSKSSPTVKESTFSHPISVNSKTWGF